MGKTKRREIPIYKNAIIETHCHLDFLKEKEIKATLKEAREKNIEQIITIAVSPENLDSILQIACDHEDVFTTQGIHPHNAQTFNQEILKKIESNANHARVLAIGEIGLDYYYNKSPKKIQIEAFESQFSLAIKMHLPIVVHSRDAEEDTIEILNKFAPNAKRKGVIHSFTSKIELAENAISHDFFIGFNGIITFKNAEEVREAVRITPLENIILETDAPYLTPTPYRGRENAPKFLPFIAEKIAEIKSIDVETVIQQTSKNARLLFGL